MRPYPIEVAMRERPQILICAAVLYIACQLDDNAEHASKVVAHETDISDNASDGGLIVPPVRTVLLLRVGKMQLLAAW